MARTFRHLIALILIGIGLFALVGEAVAQTPPTIRGNKTVFGGSFTLDTDEILEGDLTILGGTATIAADAVVRGDVSLMGGTLRLDGIVEGSVLGAGGTLHLGEQALVRGDLTTLGATLERAAGARVLGESATLSGPEGRGQVSQRQPGDFILSVLFWVGGLILKTVVLGGLALAVGIFLPHHLRTASETVARAPVTSTSVGCLSVVAFGAALVVTAITLIGLLLWPLLLLAGGAVILFGWLALGTALGDRLLRAAEVRSPRPAAAAAIGTGFLTLGTSLLGLVPCLDLLVGSLLTGLATGAVVLSRFGTYHYAAITRARTVPVSAPLLGPLPDDMIPPAPPARPTPEQPRRLDDLFADMADDTDQPPPTHR